MSGTAGKGPDDRPEGAPDPLEDAEMKAALEAAKQRRAPGEDPLFYSVEEDARRGAEGQQGEQVYVGPKTVPPAPVGRATASRVKVSAAVEAADPRRAVTVVGARRGAGGGVAAAGGAAASGGVAAGGGVAASGVAAGDGVAASGVAANAKSGAPWSRPPPPSTSSTRRGAAVVGARRDRWVIVAAIGAAAAVAVGAVVFRKEAPSDRGGLERRDLGDRGAAGRERLGDEQRGRGGGAERVAFERR